MKKGLINLIVVFTILLLIGGIVYLGTRQDANFAKTTKQVVKIQVESEYGDWQGTGVFIADDLILTAGHIVDGAKKITITFDNGKRCKAFKWHKETEADLGVVAVITYEKEPTATLANAAVGQEVWAIGNPFGVFPVMTKGIVSSISAIDDFMHQKNMIITDTATNPGNSGCPLLNKNGDILGVCSWGYSCSQGMNYFVRAEIIKLTLAKYRTIQTLKESK